MKQEIAFDLYIFLKGEDGGCGFCPAAVTGLQGDRGSQGYRGRPGVRIYSKNINLCIILIF
jgi:hypothetical protein